MKTFLLSAALLISTGMFSQNANLPSPTPNLVTLPMGSYVIAMDNNLQTNSTNHFNLKTYGLVVHLLNNNVKLKWSIKAGKAKDGIDFQGNAEIIQPTYAAASSRGFRAGPFVIYAADTAGVAQLVTDFYTLHGLTGNDRPKVYRTTVNISNVDIRFDMGGFKPKGLVLNDGGNEIIHVGYMDKCAITSTNYSVGTATNLITKCHTFASEPHHEGPTNAVVASVRRFVEYGGNFLAQCEAVETFENHSLGHFHTTGGITKLNTNVAASSVTYPNPDLPFTQFQGVYSIHQGGSVRNWYIPLLSLPQNNHHGIAQYTPPLSSTAIGASVSKLTGASLAGGLVFYIGNHEFTSTTSIESINGIRMYMNAFLTPVGINSNCSNGAQLPAPLPVEMTSFTAVNDNGNAQLEWKTVTEINNSHFVIERSLDGVEFEEAAILFSAGNSSVERTYQFTDRNAARLGTTVFYRIRTVDIDQKGKTSEVRVVKFGKMETALSIRLYPNPAQDRVTILVPAELVAKALKVEVINIAGNIVKSQSLAMAGVQERLDVTSLQKGYYIIRISGTGILATQQFSKL